MWPVLTAIMAARTAVQPCPCVGRRPGKPTGSNPGRGASALPNPYVLAALRSAGSASALGNCKPGTEGRSFGTYWAGRSLTAEVSVEA
jgi:hypothetical protein